MEFIILKLLEHFQKKTIKISKLHVCRFVGTQHAPEAFWENNYKNENSYASYGVVLTFSWELKAT